MIDRVLLKTKPLLDGAWIIGSRQSRKASFSFDQVKEFDFSESGKYGLLHSMNEIRVPWIVDAFKKGSQRIRPHEEIKILDVGCGGGILSNALASLGFDVTGIDTSPAMLEVAQKRAQKYNPGTLGKNLNFINTTPDEFDFNSKTKFDAVVASEVVEHVENVPQFVYNCVNLTKVGGFVFFTTINKTLMSLIFAKILAEYVFRVVPQGCHDWRMFVQPKDLETYLLSYGVKDIKSFGIAYNPVNRAMTRTSCTKINYAMKGVKTAEAPIYEPEAFKHR